jgi:hypothetical protein
MAEGLVAVISGHSLLDKQFCFAGRSLACMALKLIRCQLYSMLLAFAVPIHIVWIKAMIWCVLWIIPVAFAVPVHIVSMKAMIGWLFFVLGSQAHQEEICRSLRPASRVLDCLPIVSTPPWPWLNLKLSDHIATCHTSVNPRRNLNSVMSKQE